MDSEVEAGQVWILCASAVLCGLVVLMLIRKLLSLRTNGAFDAGLVVINGMRAFLLGTAMLAIVGIEAFQGREVFSMYDSGGELTLPFKLREFATYCLIGGTLCLPVDLVYLTVARLRGRRGLWTVGLVFMAPFAFLATFFLADIGSFLPMV